LAPSFGAANIDAVSWTPINAICYPGRNCSFSFWFHDITSPFLFSSSHFWPYDQGDSSLTSSLRAEEQNDSFSTPIIAICWPKQTSWLRC
jgi:hypothetical protein